MKCVILAAGEGLRMRPLTLTSPKPMIQVLNKPILEHIINDLPEQVDHLIVVVGYLGHHIINYFGNKFSRGRIDYVVQREKLGTYHALTLCKDFLRNDERFLMLYADDLHGKENLENCVSVDARSILVYPTRDPQKFGIVSTSPNGFILDIEEKPENPKSNLASTGVLVLDNKIFDYPARPHKNGEYYLTDSIDQMIKDGYEFIAVRSNFWLTLGYPEDLASAEKILKEKHPITLGI